MVSKVDIIEKSTPYQGFFRIEKYRLRHALFAGGMSEELTRELFRREPAVAVLPYDPEQDKVVLVEQFRIGAVESTRSAWLMEIIAGIVEEGETPVDVARREAREEADCELQELMAICSYYPSPGGSAEEVSLYCARVSVDGIEGVHGHPDEGEDIQVHVVAFDEAMAMLENGTIQAAAPIIALQWLALNRERIRELWT